MMNKSKILVAILSLALVLSIAYALFSENIKINGMANATGDLDITVTALTDDEISEWGLSDEGVIKSSNINVSDDTVTANVILGTPGSRKNFVIKVENTGTIPAYLKSVTDEYGNEYESGIGSYLAGKEFINSDNTSTMYVDLFIEGNALGDYEAGEPWYYFDSIGIDDISPSILDPGEATYFLIEYFWKSDSTSQEEISLPFTAKLNWAQVTN